MPRIIKHHEVRRVSTDEAGPPVVGATTEATTPARSPGVRVHRADGRVHAIEVTCACGETTLVELAYEENER